MAPTAEPKDILDTAAAAGQFRSLVLAVKAAELVATFKGDGPYTVFAPSDAAFAKLPVSRFDALLKNKAALSDVLRYHVLPGRHAAADVARLRTVDTAQGNPVVIAAAGGAVTVNGATVVTSDIGCKNGVIHVIDDVLLPPR